MTETAVPGADETAGAPQADAYARGARILSIGIASTGIFTFAYFAVASHVLDADAYGADLAAVGGAVRRHLGHLPPGRAAAVAHDRRPARARPSRPAPAADPAARAGGLRGRLPRRRPGAARARSRTPSTRRRSTGSSSARRWPTPPATSPAATWPATSGSRSTAASCSSSRCRASASRSRSRSASPTGSRPSRWASSPRRVASLLVVPWAIVRHSAGRRPGGRSTSARSRCARAPASPLSVAAIQLAEQALLNASVLTVSATATTALAGVVFNALLITRAPLQLFQSIQTSLLPHLSGLEATEGHEAFARAIRVTAPGHRRLRRRGGARAAAHRAVGDGRRLRPRLPLRARRAGRHRGRHGLPPLRGDVQPGRAGPRPRPRRGDDVAGRAPRSSSCG